MADPLAAHELTGVIHCHSTYSDGTGTVPEIAAAARANDLDYVLLTDHDTLAAADNGEEGWHGSVLVLVGEEVSPYRRNHYLAFGLREPIDHRGLSPAQIVARVNEAGGFGFPAHPLSRGSQRFTRGAQGMPWDDLDADGIAGIELWSFVTDTAERLNSIPDVLRFILAPGRFVDHPPPRNLAEWDRLGRRRRCVGLGGVDAHQVGIRVAGRVPLRLMAYRRSFRHLRTHLLVAEPLRHELEDDRAAVLGALRAGHAFLAMDSVGRAQGFRFWGEDSERVLWMGDEAPAGEWTLRASLPAPARWRLVRDGAEVAAGAGTALEHRAEGPGVYRVEAYRHARGRERTWVLSNPVYLR
ncbi:MAG TPA: CehA/McbA family metallohydrolase [Micromonosporaceae bacterium]|nr:CehA/McbA family metallohydrolase [Micromonosporaceae bacterium]